MKKTGDTKYVFAYRNGKVHEVTIQAEDKGDYFILKDGLKMAIVSFQILTNHYVTVRNWRWIK